MRGAYGGDAQGSEDQSWAAKMKNGLELMRDAERPLPTIIYASRTHSQLAQVMRELNSSGYRCMACPGSIYLHAAAVRPFAEQAAPRLALTSKISRCKPSARCRAVK